MSKRTRQSKSGAWRRRWSLISVVLLIILTGHWTLVADARAEEPTSEPAVSRDRDQSPEHAAECGFGGRLVSPDRVRLGSVVLDTAGPVPAHLTLDGTHVSEPVLQGPPLAPNARRAFLQIYLI